MIDDNVNIIQSSADKATSASAISERAKHEIETVQTTNQLQKNSVEEINKLIHDIMQLADETNNNIATMDNIAGGVLDSSQSLYHMVEHFKL